MQYPPRDSALVRLNDPDHWITPEVQMLREVCHGLDVLRWQRTEGAQKNPPKGFPERMPLTAAEIALAKAQAEPVYDAEPIEDIADFLGWSRPNLN